MFNYKEVNMGITKIAFENVKSLSGSFLNTKSLNVLIGTNGAGKSNIEKYINYFYKNLLSSNVNPDIFDKMNPYNDYAKISITYSLTEFFSNKINRRKDIFIDIKEELDEKDELVLELIQYKDNRIEWNYSYEIRKIIKYLFPIYFIDTRNLNVLDWDIVWDIIGDLGQSRSEVEDGLIESLNKVLEEIYGEKHLESYDLLKSEFESNGYGIKSYNNKDVFKQLYKLKFNGERFIYKNNHLEFYSNGSNSYNYIKLFYQVLKKLHLNKIKTPIIILDEPEIGLHPNLIDEFINLILLDSGRIQTILSTHSPRLVKNAMILDKANIFQITYDKYKTQIRKVENINKEKLKKVISDKEASYYFAKGIIFVEGISEYELFTHPVLRKRFPILKEIEIFSYNSNNISLDVSHPVQRKLNIPYLLLLDLDKILTYNKALKMFDITGDNYNPLKNDDIEEKEKYHYGNLRKLGMVRKRIQGISQKAKFKYNPYNFCFNDGLFDEFIDLVKSYCISYNVYPVSTTIEGVLVNEENYRVFYSWLTRKKSNYMGKKDLKNLWTVSTNKFYRLNILRQIVDGKMEPLFTLKKRGLLEEVTDQNLKDAYTKALKLPKLDKGSGWVSNFLNDVNAVLKKTNQLSKFNSLFPELVDIIETMELIKE